MTIEQIKQLSKEIHEGNVKRGFWDDERSLSEVLMLIRTEMSEAVEADRKGRNADVTKYKEAQSLSNEIDSEFNINPSILFNAVLFNNFIKDTVEDELADTVIRILDASVTDLIHVTAFYNSLDFGINNLGLISRYYPSIADFAEFWNYYFPFSGRFRAEELCTSMLQIISFCEQANIDIWWHVKEKLKYNATRPYKHGKKY